MTNQGVLRLESLCLRYPGIELVEFIDEPSGMTPKQAWAHVIMMESKPSIVFTDDRISDAQDSWWRLARSNRLLSDQETCLISIGGLGQLPWARIRLPERAPVFDIFAVDAGSPEFIVMNQAGDRLLAVTSEEHETWLYLVERQDAQLRTVPQPGEH